MSNPYDPNSGQSGQYPEYPAGGGYGSPGGGGFGGGSYPVNPYGSGGEAPKETDKVSIIGFVLSLTCCLSIVGAIMGFVGLGRTKGGRRKGRWAAITAIVVGILGTLAAAGTVVAIVFFAEGQITVDDAEVGQCANVTEGSDDTLLLRERECSESHDAEIVYVGEFSEIEDTELMPGNIDDLSDAAISQTVCSQLMDQEDVQTLGEDVTWTFALEDPNDPASDDPFICYVERSDGEKLSEKLL